jgi:transcription antitermination factor NusG
MALTIEQSAPELLIRRSYFSAEIPSDLLQKTRAIWFVAQTKSRQEKTFARFIQDNMFRELFYFLPYFSRKAKPAKHNSPVSFNPLFPGFVFLGVPCRPSELNAGMEHQRIVAQFYTNRLFASKAVFSYLFAPNQAKLRSELAMIASSRPEDRAPVLTNSQLTKGASAKIMRGPYMGMVGKVYSPPIKNRQKIVMLMEAVGGEYELTVDVSDLELA